MAFDAFMKIDGVDGESDDAQYLKWIEVQSFKWGAARAGGGTAGRVVAEDFQIVHEVDRASPLLMRHCCDGTHIPTATLSCRRAGAQPLEFLKYKMTEVIISSFHPGGIAAGPNGTPGDNTPTEQVTLNFQKMTYSYRPQNPDGSAGVWIEETCDFTAAPSSVLSFGG